MDEIEEVPPDETPEVTAKKKKQHLNWNTALKIFDPRADKEERGVEAIVSLLRMGIKSFAVIAIAVFSLLIIVFIIASVQVFQAPELLAIVNMIAITILAITALWALICFFLKAMRQVDNIGSAEKEFLVALFTAVVTILGVMVTIATYLGKVV